MNEFRSVDDTDARLSAAGYLSDPAISTVVFLATRLHKPVLVEGPAGVGKTELAKAIARATEAELVRLQCYEGLDEAKALYEWNYKRQLLRITHARSDTAGDGQRWEDVEDDLFSEEYLLERPLLHALRNHQPTVLLIDEVDKVDFEFEALLLEILAEFQVTIPEMGTIVAAQQPIVVLTSNNTRELSEALKRRCLYLYLDYPTRERELAIVSARVPELADTLAEQVVRIVQSLRTLELKKPPSISESLDWARTLVELGLTELDARTAEATLGAVLKYQQDVDKARGHLAVLNSGVNDDPRPRRA